jgi:glycosyltransferase involved in cell wall biosynthesis
MGVGGAERQLCLLVAGQVGLGEDVHVALIHDGPHSDRLKATGATVHRLRVSSNHDPRIGTKLFALIRRTRPSIVQTWLPQMDVFGGLAARAASRPWVLSERSMASAYEARWKDRTLRPAVGRRADAIVANSPGGREYWAGRVADTTLLVVVPNALDLEAIASAAAVPHPVPSTPPGPFLLFAGRLSPEKNLAVLLDALAIVARQSSVPTVLCGDGPLAHQVADDIRRHGLENRVGAAGVRSDLWGIMKSALTLVSPSLFEGQPNVVLEAAAAGCPLVLSDIAGHRAVMDDTSALFFRPDSASELAGALLATLHDPSAASRRAACAREIANRHSLEHALPGYQAVYDQLLPRYR